MEAVWSVQREVQQDQAWGAWGWLDMDIRLWPEDAGLRSMVMAMEGPKREEEGLDVCSCCAGTKERAGGSRGAWTKTCLPESPSSMW